MGGRQLRCLRNHRKKPFTQRPRRSVVPTERRVQGAVVAVSFRSFALLELSLRPNFGPCRRLLRVLVRLGNSAGRRALFTWWHSLSLFNALLVLQLSPASVIATLVTTERGEVPGRGRQPL